MRHLRAPGMCKGAYVLLQGQGGGNEGNRAFSAMKMHLLTYSPKGGEEGEVSKHEITY